MTFWGTEFFRSEGDESNEVEYGTTLEAAIVRQVDPESLSVSEEVFDVTSSESLIVVLMALLLPLLCVPG